MIFFILSVFILLAIRDRLLIISSFPIQCHIELMLFVHRDYLIFPAERDKNEEKEENDEKNARTRQEEKKRLLDHSIIKVTAYRDIFQSTRGVMD